MATFVPGQTIATPDSSIEVTVSPAAPLAPGRHRFQLVRRALGRPVAGQDTRVPVVVDRLTGGA